MMRNTPLKLMTTAALLVLVLIARAADDNPRRSICLGDGWAIKPLVDVNKNAPMQPVTLPHTWNASYLPDTTLYNREAMVYQRRLEVTPDMAGHRLFLYFEGVNSAADVFVNRRTVAHHLGGYTAFCVEITDQVSTGDNALEVWASNAYRTDVLPISGDFNVYGGIHRPCHLIVTGPDCITPLHYASPGVLIHQKEVSAEQAHCEVEVLLSLRSGHSDLKVRASMLDHTGAAVATSEAPAGGERATVNLNVDRPTLWNGRLNPYLYTVVVDLMDGDRIVDRVTQQTGLRYFEVDADRGFLLNGQPYDVHGLCRHEDVKGKGSALTQEDYDRDIALINEIGATGMRLTHYPHAHPIYDLCDQNGIILWTEIPLVGPGGYNYTGFLDNDGLKDNARQCVNELVYQNYNHPSICFWGIFNELLMDDGRNLLPYDNPVELVSELNDLFHRLDPSRPTTYATCVDQKFYLDCADLVAWNKYFAWNGGHEIGPFMDQVKAESGGRPVGVSEYGFGGSTLQHRCVVNEAGAKLARGEHPEEFQAYSHECNWEALSGRPYLWAKFIWVFADFQSVLRREGDTDGINDKGMLTYDRQTRKEAFYFYKANWNAEPMLHLCGQRFTQRSYAITQIKAYTNLGSATLYVNGKKVGRAKADRICRVVWDNIKLEPGENTIEVRTKNGKTELSEQCVWTLQQ